jgi:hypothetical protein
VALAVVDLLQPVNVDEGEYQGSARSMCTLELARYLFETERARPSAGQLVRRSPHQVVFGCDPLPTSLSALTGGFLPVSGRTSAIIGRLDPVGRGTRSIALCVQKHVRRTRVGATLLIVQASQRIARFRAMIAARGRTVAIVGRLQPRVGALVAQCGHGVAVVSRTPARRGASIVRSPVAAGSEVVVCSMLILVGAALIAVAGGLVVIRPGLILIAPRLILIRRRGVLITRRFVPAHCAIRALSCCFKECQL